MIFPPMGDEFYTQHPQEVYQGEWTNMKAKLGKQTGIALALLATLLATFLTMGVFSVAEAQASHSASRVFSDTTVTPDGEVMVAVTINLSGYVGNGLVVETLAAGFSLGNSTPPPFSTQGVVSVWAFQEGVEKIEYTATAPSQSEPYEEFEGTFTAGTPGVSVDITGDSTVTVPAATSGGNGDGTDATDGNGGGTDEVNEATDSTTPGSNQSLVLKSTIEHDNTEDIIVKLGKFGVPSSIDTRDVRISLTGGAADSGFPSDVEVDGTTVTLVGPVVDGDGENVGSDDHTGATISFRRGAGITLPIRHGDYDVEVENADGDDDGVENQVNVRREVKVKPASGKRGTEITITAKGYSDNTHDIMIGSGDNSLTRTADAEDGVFTLTLDTAIKNNDGNSVFQGPHDEETTIEVGDASATFTVKASFSWSPESPTPGQDITVTLADIEPDTGEAVEITIGGEDVLEVGDAGDDKDTTWKGQVNGETRLGNRKIAVSVGDTELPSQNITVGTNDLTVSPTTVVPRQTISIDGDGFTARGSVDLSEVTVDGEQVKTDSGETEAINNNGNVSFDIVVPETVSSGPATVKVVGSGDRIGTASITVATAEITVSPAESLRGSTITVSGTGFPANDLVLIKYNTATVDTSSTSPTGTFEQDITIPATENINPGGKYTVEAISQVNADPVSDTEQHKVSDPTIVISPDTAAPGSNITITGSNFKGFLRVASIEIGGQDVTPVPAPSTDRWGAFTAADIQVPQLNQTRHAVKVVVGRADGSDGDATEFLTVSAAVVEVATDPADVFASLDDRLTRVWQFDNATQSWSFYDPRPEFADFNTLTEVSSGQIVTAILSEGGAITFASTPGTLYAGTNQVVLD